MKTLLRFIPALFFVFALQTDLYAQLQVKSTYVGGSTVIVGQGKAYKLAYSWPNAFPGTHNIVTKVVLPTSLEFVSGDNHTTGQYNSTTQKWTVTSTWNFAIIQNLSSGIPSGNANFVVRFKANTPNGTQACPVVTIQEGTFLVNESNEPCLTALVMQNHWGFTNELKVGSVNNSPDVVFLVKIKNAVTNATQEEKLISPVLTFSIPKCSDNLQDGQITAITQDKSNKSGLPVGWTAQTTSPSNSFKIIGSAQLIAPQEISFFVYVHIENVPRGTVCSGNVSLEYSLGSAPQTRLNYSSSAPVKFK